MFFCFTKITFFIFRKFFSIVHKSNELPSIEDFNQYSVVNNNRLDISFTFTKLDVTLHSYCKNYYFDNILYSNYRNRDECLRICILGDYFRANITCHYYFPPIMLEHLYGGQKQLTVCPHDQQDYSKYLFYKNLCEFHCQNECQLERIETYSLSTKFSYETTKKTYTQFRIQFSTYPIQSIRYRIVIDDNELLAIFGGHLGLWLGSSVICIINGIAYVFMFILRIFLKIFCIHRIAKWLLKHFD